MGKKSVYSSLGSKCYKSWGSISDFIDEFEYDDEIVIKTHKGWSEWASNHGKSLCSHYRDNTWICNAHYFTHLTDPWIAMELFYGYQQFAKITKISYWNGTSNENYITSFCGNIDMNRDQHHHYMQCLTPNYSNTDCGDNIPVYYEFYVNTQIRGKLNIPKCSKLSFTFTNPAQRYHYNSDDEDIEHYSVTALCTIIFGGILLIFMMAILWSMIINLCFKKYEYRPHMIPSPSTGIKCTAFVYISCQLLISAIEVIYHLIYVLTPDCTLFPPVANLVPLICMNRI